MHRRLFSIVAVLGALAAMPVARGAPTEQTFLVQTTGALVDLCSDISPSDPLTTAAQNFCEGFVVGVYQVLVQVDAGRARPAFCVMHPPTRRDAIATFVQWVNTHPSEAARPPADGVFAFLVHQFPCPATPR